MDTFWSRFANDWDLLLHGSPAVDIYNGMKLAAGGELGMGVGEEDWGSGERLVLEDFVQKTDGLVDLMVSRFGEPSPEQNPTSTKAGKATDVSDAEPWMGTGSIASAADGIVFSGVGAIKPQSLRVLSQWVESIYYYGDHAYGVRDNPTTDRRKRRRRTPKPSPSPARPVVDRSTSGRATNDTHSPNQEPPRPRIPPPIVKAVESSLDKASSAVESKGKADTSKANTGETSQGLASLGDTETWMKYLTLGYGSAWGNKRSPADDQSSAQEAPSTSQATTEAPMTYVEPKPDIDVAEEKLKAQIRHENTGYFPIGLKGDMDDESVDDSNDEGDWNNRTLLRTVHVELAQKGTSEATAGDEDETPSTEKGLSLPSFSTPNFSNLSRLRPVVYVVSTNYTVREKRLTRTRSIVPSSTPFCSNTVPKPLQSPPSTAIYIHTSLPSTDHSVTARRLIGLRRVFRRPLTCILRPLQPRLETL
jgi:hypothetical protein